MKNKRMITRYGDWFLGLFLLLSGPSLWAQKLDLKWAISLKSTEGVDYGQDIAVDNKGNTYITGQLTNTVDFDPGPGTALFEARTDGVNTYMGDAFLAKYDTAGNYLWAKGIGSKSDDRGNRVAVDAEGNVYVAGMIGQTPSPVYFDTGVNAPFINVSIQKNDDGFLTKYDAAGDFLWAKNMGGTGSDACWALGVSKDGKSVYTASMVSAGWASDTVGILLNKFSSAGSEVWRKYITDNVGGLLIPTSIALDQQENLYVTGALNYTDTVDFDPGAGTAYWVSQGAISDGFLAKYDSAGNYAWVQGKLQGSLFSYNQSQGVAVDGDNNIYIAGYFNGTLYLDSAGISVTTNGANDGFLAKYNEQGTCLWAKNYGSLSLEGANAVAVDKAGNVYIAGAFRNTVDFDPGPGVANLTSAGNVDGCWVKYDCAGNYVQAGRMGGGGEEQCRGIALDLRGNVYITGDFRSLDATFDPGTDTLSCPGVQNAFLYKMSATEDTSSVLFEVTACGESYHWNGTAYEATGIYAQHFRNVHGCDSSVTLDLTLNHIEKPVVNVDIDTLSTVQTYVSYQWMKNDIVIPGATLSRYTVTENADYRVIVRNEKDCIDTSATYTVTNHGLSIHDVSGFGKAIQIYPNPANNFIHINSPVPIKILLTSIEGRRVMIKEDAQAISVKDLANGLYLIHISDKEGNLIRVEKVIKQ